MKKQLDLFDVGRTQPMYAACGDQIAFIIMFFLTRYFTSKYPFSAISEAVKDETD